MSAARSTSSKPLAWKSLKRSAAGALTSGRRPGGDGVEESLRPIRVLILGPPGQVTMAWEPAKTGVVRILILWS